MVCADAVCGVEAGPATMAPVPQGGNRIMGLKDMTELGAVMSEDERPDEQEEGGVGTAVLERPETKEQPQSTDDGDADRFAHYVSKDRIMESRITGRPVVALCGKIWVPKRDPSQYPVCPDCRRIYESMTGGRS